MAAYNYNELIDKLEAIIEHYTIMEESFRESNHFAHRTRDELDKIREKGVDIHTILFYPFLNSFLGFIDVIMVFDKVPIAIVSGGQEVEDCTYQI